MMAPGEEQPEQDADTYPYLRLHTYDLSTNIETIWEKWQRGDGALYWRKIGMVRDPLVKPGPGY